MAKSTRHAAQIAILDSSIPKQKKTLGLPSYHTVADIEKIYHQNPRLTWVSWVPDLTDRLVKIISQQPSRDWLQGVIVTIHPPRPKVHPVLEGLFGRIVGASHEYKWLPKKEIQEVFAFSPETRSEIFLAVSADQITETISLIRGDFKVLVVPFSLFKPSGKGLRPDFTRIVIADYGRTLALGEYEAASDAILYEADSDYRKNRLLKRRQSERSFGASLYRLRKQRMLTRKDFAPLTDKTIARIERNEIDKPHGKTLHILSERLGVPADEIETY